MPETNCIKTITPISRNKGISNVSEAKEIYFWDIENQPNFKINNKDVVIFIVGKLSLINAETIKNFLINQNNQIIYLIDTNFSNKNYADIICATIIGYTVRNFKNLNSISLISNDKGFESIKIFLESLGYKNINILSSVNIKQNNKSNAKNFISEITKRYVNKEKFNIKNFFKLAKENKIENDIALEIIEDNFKYKEKDDKYIYSLSAK